MFFYRQSIIVFGVIVPLLFAAGIIAGAYMMLSKMNNSFVLKERQYKDHLTNREQVKLIEELVAADRPHLQRWQELLSREAASVVGTELKAITDQLPEKEIQQTAYNPSNNEKSIGAASKQASASIDIGFRGTYRTLQQAFLQLETKLPNLQLENISLKPAKNSSYLLGAQVTYTAWQE